MKVDEMIMNQVKIGKISHAYLIFGPIEVSTFQELLEVNLADYFLINEEPIRIESVRQLIHWINLKPHSSKYKLAVIKDAENLTLEAANSLLKVLEEPPNHSIIILKANKKDRILPTIISRCQILRTENNNTSMVIPDNYITPKELAGLDFFSRFQYVQKITESAELLKIIHLWEKYYREKLLLGEDCLDILGVLNRTNNLLMTNTSVKLLLENLVLRF